MSKWVLYSLLVGLMVIWGFNVSAIKILVTYFPAASIQGIRILLAGIAVLSFLFLSKSLQRVSRKNILGILVASIFGVVGHHLFLAVGLTTSTATNAGLILGLIPLCTSILAMLFLGERFTVSKSLGILVALVGVYFIVMNDEGSLNGLAIGDLYLVGAVITQAISFILIKKLTDNIDSKQMTGMMLFFGALMLLVPSLFIEQVVPTNFVDVPAYVWWILIGSAIIATGLGHVLYNYAMQQLGAGTTAIFINLTPFFSLVGSTLFLGEVITTKHLIGFSCIIAGVILGTGTLKLRYKSKYPQTEHIKIAEKF
ncbi:DMT family transporter [Bacillus sp. DJP31]|uniref:DMT family transporter n=1 Tax=Bacillus sp. DJP31 TaxID=3409789 RepID=UPI003BB4F413